LKPLFIVFKKISGYSRVATDELKNYDNVIFDKKINNRILLKVNTVHTAIRTNKYFRIPLQKIWFKYYLDEDEIDQYDEKFFFFQEGTRMGYSPEYLTYLRIRYPNAKLVFSFTNPIGNANSKYIKLIKKHYDLILSFDIADCEKYGWTFYSGVYSKRDDIDLSDIAESDVFFVGANKGRIDAVHEIYDLLTEHGLNCDFHVTDVEKTKIRNDTTIHYNKRLSYEEVLARVCKTKCVLEILQENQKGSSLRVMEAIVYGKKLLTNNRTIKYERFYKENQMFVFEKPSDIDIEFLLNSTEKFDYDGSLSPYRRLLFIQDYFRNDQKK
jgi:hypothetical protein